MISNLKTIIVTIIVYSLFLGIVAVPAYMKMKPDSARQKCDSMNKGCLDMVDWFDSKTGYDRKKTLRYREPSVFE